MRPNVARTFGAAIEAGGEACAHDHRRLGLPRHRRAALRRGAAAARHGAPVRAATASCPTWPSGSTTAPSPRSSPRRWVRSGLLGMHLDRLRVRRHQRGRLRPGLPRARGRRQRRPQLRVGAGLARHVPDLEVRQRGAEAGVAATHGGRRGDRLLRPDRARLRQRPVEHAHHRPARRRRLGAQRHEDVDHQRRRSPTWRSSGPAPTICRAGPYAGFVVPTDTPGLHGQRHPEEAVAARVGHVRARARRRAAAGLGAPARGALDARSAVVPQRGALRHPVGRGRRRSRLLRVGARLREGTRAVRRADRVVPAHAAQARRDDGEGQQGLRWSRCTSGA